MIKKMYIHDHQGSLARLIDIIICEEDYGILRQYEFILGWTPGSVSWTDNEAWTNSNYYRYKRQNP